VLTFDVSEKISTSIKLLRIFISIVNYSAGKGHFIN